MDAEHHLRWITIHLVVVRLVEGLRQKNEWHTSTRNVLVPVPGLEQIRAAHAY